MIKRILFILCAVFMFLNISVAQDFSKNPNLYWVTSNSTVTMYINTKSLEYNPSTDTAMFYITSAYPADRCYYVSKVSINYTRNTLCHSNTIKYFYDNDSTYIEIPETKTIEIRPDTLGEAVKNTSASLAGRDAKLAEYKAQQEEQLKEQEKKKKEAEEKAESEKRRERNNRIAGAVLSGLGSLF